MVISFIYSLSHAYTHISFYHYLLSHKIIYNAISRLISQSSMLHGERHFCIEVHSSIKWESFLDYDKSLRTTLPSLESFDNYLALADPEHVEQHARFSYMLGVLNFKSKHIDLFKRGTRCCRVVRCNNSSFVLLFCRVASCCIVLLYPIFCYIFTYEV